VLVCSDARSRNRASLLHLQGACLRRERIAMSQEGAFYSGKLRLSVFLRVVNSIPHRPTRFQNRAPYTAGDHHVVQQPPFRSVPTPIDEIIPDQNNRNPEERVITQLTPSNSSRVRDDEITLDQKEGGWVEPVSPPPRRSLAVYASKSEKEDARRVRVSCARKRRLPVNELALVRTSTTDGLPDRSVGDSLT
jgi:hypothetical protein